MFKELVPNFADFRQNNSMVEYHFVKKHHKVQETRNNCFGSKKCSTTLCQLKTGKHECQNVTALLQTSCPKQHFLNLNIKKRCSTESKLPDTQVILNLQKS